MYHYKRRFLQMFCQQFNVYTLYFRYVVFPVEYLGMIK